MAAEGESGCFAGSVGGNAGNFGCGGQDKRTEEARIGTKRKQDGKTSGRLRGPPVRTNGGFDGGRLAAYDADEFAELLGIADV
jgi:hypothetical protein